MLRCRDVLSRNHCRGLRSSVLKSAAGTRRGVGTVRGDSQDQSRALLGVVKVVRDENRVSLDVRRTRETNEMLQEIIVSSLGTSAIHRETLRGMSRGTEDPPITLLRADANLSINSIKFTYFIVGLHG